MHAHHLQFKIDQLRKDKMILILESIAIFIAALFITVFLPQLLFQFIFANKELTAEPPIIRYIPVASFTVAILYFIYATVMLLMKKMKIMQLEKEMAMAMTDDSCDCDGHHHDHHHDDWMNTLEEDEEVKEVESSSTKKLAAAMTQSKKKTPAKKKTSKKA